MHKPRQHPARPSTMPEDESLPKNSLSPGHHLPVRTHHTNHWVKLLSYLRAQSFLHEDVGSGHGDVAFKALGKWCQDVIRSQHLETTEKLKLAPLQQRTGAPSKARTHLL